jgi:hypothetical protein
MIYRQSTILAKYSSFDGVSAEVLAEAQYRGSAIHRTIAARLLGVYAPPLPKEWQGYMASFEQFEPMIKKIYGVEKQFVDEGLGVSGTIDLLGEIEGKPGISIVDWKSPVTIYRTWSASMAVYKYLSKADNCGTLRLKADGGIPKMTWWEGDMQALPAFFGALQAHKYFIGEKEREVKNGI